MTNKKMAKDYMEQAEYKIILAQKAFEDGRYNISVRQAQECVELSLKAALRYVGIEPPRWHDVSIILKEKKERFPKGFVNSIDKISFISRTLRKEREASMYGDEERGIAPSAIYTRYDAAQAIEWAKEVQEICKELVHEGGV
jgi:HEPN domain-containing protein